MRALRSRPTAPARACLVALSAALLATPCHAQEVHSLAELEKEIPLDPKAPATIKEIARSGQASVNFWQTTVGIPPHVHREHEEVIVVEAGQARARIGERTVTLGAGDVLLVPRNTTHSARVFGEEPFRGYSVFAPAFDGKDRVPVDEDKSHP
jgi:mannose-6-phosphate isomerase-like protein (cupin superfamily)